MGERPAPAGGSPRSVGSYLGRGIGAAPEPAPQAPGGRLTRPYSGVIPASFISLDHFAWSPRTKLELPGSVARGLGAEAEHFLAHIPHREHAIRIGGELRHRRFRRRRR